MCLNVTSSSQILHVQLSKVACELNKQLNLNHLHIHVAVHLGDINGLYKLRVQTCNTAWSPSQF